MNQGRLARKTWLGGFGWVPALMLATTVATADGGPWGEEAVLFQDIPSVFGASKYEQKVTEAPSSISIVTSTEIRRHGYRTLADILRSLRSFFVTDDHNYSYVGVRGFGRPGDYNSRILLLVDGHRVNDNLYGSAMIGREFILDIDLIERVEVIRGPSSSLYGAGAFFAVVNVFTKRGRDFQGLEGAGEASSHDAYAGRLSYGRRSGSGLEWLLSASASDSKGTDWYYPEFDAPGSNDGFAEGLDGERFKSAYYKASLGDFTLTGAYSRRQKTIPTAPWEVVFNDGRTATVDSLAYLNLQYDRTFAGSWQMLGRAFYDRYRYQGAYPYDWADYDTDPAATPDIVLGDDKSEGRWWGGEFQVGRQFDAGHRLLVGAEYRDNWKQDQGYQDDGDDPATLILDSRESSEYWAAFAQEEVQLLPRLALSAGVRYDHYSTFGGTTNPRLALIFSLHERTTLKLLYGEAFRAPNAYELSYHDGNKTQKQSSGLEPETIASYEVVAEQYLGNNFRWMVSGFCYEIENLINLTVDPDDDLLVFVNFDQVEARGLELEVEGKSKGGAEGRISHTYVVNEDKITGQILSNSPKHLTKINLIFPLWRDKISLGLEEQYTSSRKTVAVENVKVANKLGGYAITNLTLFGHGLIEGLEMSASVYNLFDKQYSVPGGSEHLQSGIEQDGRLFRLKVSYLF